LILRDGDILDIPEQMQTVKITGNVQNPFSVTYEEGKSLKYYIDRCGGFSTDALKRKVYVRYPNGATASTKSFIVKNYPEVLPGSQIVVPAKPEREGVSTSTWLSIASTFSSIAVAIAAVLR
jgi:protein involved in polysaccharide export with SLBB domain